MQIDLCGRDGTVSQNTLDIGDIHILLQQQRGKRMTESVGRHVLVDMAFLHQPTHQHTYRLRA